MSGPDILIALVGPCASGKSTLGRRLRELGYTVREPAQEHSFVPELWRHMGDPDLLIFLDVGLAMIEDRAMKRLLDPQRSSTGTDRCHGSTLCRSHAYHGRLQEVTSFNTLSIHDHLRGYRPSQHPGAIAQETDSGTGCRIRTCLVSLRLLHPRGRASENPFRLSRYCQSIVLPPTEPVKSKRLNVKEGKSYTPVPVGNILFLGWRVPGLDDTSTVRRDRRQGRVVQRLGTPRSDSQAALR